MFLPYPCFQTAVFSNFQFLLNAEPRGKGFIVIRSGWIFLADGLNPLIKVASVSICICSDGCDVAKGVQSSWEVSHYEKAVPGAQFIFSTLVYVLCF